MTTQKFLLNLILMLIIVGIDMKALSYFLHTKKEWWRKGIAFFSCWIVTGNILYIGDRTNLPLSLGIFVVGMYIACEGSGIRKVAVSVMISSMIMAYNTLADNWGERLFATVSFYVAGRVLFAVFFYLAAKHFGPEEDYELVPSMWRLLLLLSLTPLGIVTVVVMVPSPYWYDITGFWLHFFLLLIAFFTFAGLLWTISVLAKQRKMEQQVLFAEINRNYYDTIEQQQFEVRRLKHDLANHIQTLSALSEDQRDVYIGELLKNESVTKTLNYCGDTTVNAVLTAKESMMRQRGIQFQYQIGIPGELPFEKIDVCAIFANALDNAAEACVRQSLPEKTVWLECRIKKGMFVFLVKNPTKIDVQTDGIPQTSKADTKNHGFGLQSIQEIAKRHGGEMEIRTEDGWFELFVYFPMV